MRIFYLNIFIFKILMASLFGRTNIGFIFGKQLKEKKSEKDLYIATIKTDLGEYELKVCLKHEKLIITFESEIEFLSIYSYSKELSFEELKKLSNNFKSCENIEQSFTTFINILKEFKFTINNKDYKSEFKVEFSADDSLTMRMTIPLIYEEYETIEIIFEKKKKDLFEQFKTLRSKYLKVKEIISFHKCDDNYYNQESLSTKIKNIENQKKVNDSIIFNNNTLTMGTEIEKKPIKNIINNN